MDCYLYTPPAPHAPLLWSTVVMRWLPLGRVQGHLSWRKGPAKVLHLLLRALQPGSCCRRAVCKGVAKRGWAHVGLLLFLLLVRTELWHQRETFKLTARAAASQLLVVQTDCTHQKPGKVLRGYGSFFKYSHVELT